jgi:hypothetical protein
VSVVLASGTDENGYWEFRCTPAFAARWAFAKAYALKHFGRTIFIRTGWNIYRPIASQRVARANACAAGNCAGAAVAGSSSHGGNWNGRDCLAVDVDPNGLTWDQVDEAMSAAGFAVQQITEAMSGISGGERWHYIDFAAFGAVPAFTEETEFTPEPEEEDMSYSIINTTDGKIMLVSLVTGKRAHIGSPYHVTLLQRQRKNDPVDVMLEAELDVTGAYLLAVNPPVNATVDTAALAAALGKIDAAQDAAVVKQAVKDALAEATFKTTVS